VWINLGYKELALKLGSSLVKGLLYDDIEKLLHVMKSIYYNHIVVDIYIKVIFYFFIMAMWLHMLRHTCHLLYIFDAIYRINQPKGWLNHPLP
jgi:hypothetical protein